MRSSKAANQSPARSPVLHRKHIRLRFLYAALCVLQLSIMAADLILAHRLERSYSAQIAYETALNQHQHGIAQLRALADAGAPAELDASPDDWAAGVERVQYGSALFQQQAQTLLAEAESSADPAFSGCAADLRSLLSESQAMVRQVQQAEQARRAASLPLFKAASFAADRNLSHLRTTLGNISQNISNTKNELLDQEADRVRQTRINLISLTIIGLFLVAPVIAYARGLSEQIAAFDAELQAERDALEQRVQERTAQLRTEIGERIRIEEFNRSENRILEMVAEGALLADHPVGAGPGRRGLLSRQPLSHRLLRRASRSPHCSQLSPPGNRILYSAAGRAGRSGLPRAQPEPCGFSLRPGAETHRPRSHGAHRAISVCILVLGALRRPRWRHRRNHLHAAEPGTAARPG